jgi:hypothetical protein
VPWLRWTWLPERYDRQVIVVVSATLVGPSFYFMWNAIP